MNFILAKKKIDLYYNINNLFWTISLIIIIILLNFEKSIESAVISYFIIPAFICLGYIFFFQFKITKISNQNFIFLFKQFISYSISIYIFSILSLTFIYIFRFFGLKYFTTEELAFLTLSMMIANVFTQFLPNITNTLLLSKIPGASLKNNVNLLLKVFRVNFFFNLVFSIFFIYALQFLIPIIYGDKFYDVNYFIRNIFIAFAFYNSSSILSTFFTLNGKIRINIFTILISLFFIILMFLLLEKNIENFFLNLNLSFLLISLIRIHFIKKIYNIKYYDFLIKTNDLIYIYKYYLNILKKFKIL